MRGSRCEIRSGAVSIEFYDERGKIWTRSYEFGALRDSRGERADL